MLALRLPKDVEEKAQKSLAQKTGQNQKLLCPTACHSGVFLMIRKII